MMSDKQKYEIYELVMAGELKQDFVVLEDMHTLPVMNQEYHSQYFYLGLCTKGYLLGQYDYQDTEFCAGDICWVMPDHVLSHNYVSSDYTTLSVFISKPFFNRLIQQGMLGKYQYMTAVSCIALSSAVFDVMLTGFRLAGMISLVNDSKGQKYVASLLNILAAVADDYIKEKVPEVLMKNNNHEQLFEQFYEAIAVHYRESREVAFYARLFCRSPKYFATVIKETTGIPASEWINRYVITEAKWLLLHEREMSILQIANKLGFSEQASFSRLFKKMESVTPSKFRSNG